MQKNAKEASDGERNSRVPYSRVKTRDMEKKTE